MTILVKCHWEFIFSKHKLDYKNKMNCDIFNRMTPLSVKMGLLFTALQ